MARKKLHPVDLYEQRQIARAAYFTTCRFLGRGQYHTEKHMTLDSARAAAGSDPRVMIYAVTPDGFTVHVSRMTAR
jgi:hypothetical protein